MKIFRDTFWERVAPAFPVGCDPYNNLDEVRRRDAELILAMEECWRKCFAPGEPAVMYVDPVVWNWMNRAPVPGHEFFPYG